MEEFAAFILAGVGLTALIVWPTDGPGAALRERVLRRALPRKWRGALDCYICLGFWAGLALSIPWYLRGSEWAWAGCLMVPAVFWIALREAR